MSRVTTPSNLTTPDISITTPNGSQIDAPEIVSDNCWEGTRESEKYECEGGGFLTYRSICYVLTNYYIRAHASEVARSHETRFITKFRNL